MTLKTLTFFHRAFRGRLVTLKVRYQSQGRQVEDFEIWSHQNETVGAVRRHILQRVKANSNFKVDLYANNEQLDPNDDKKLISQIPLRDKMVTTFASVFLTFLSLSTFLLLPGYNPHSLTGH